MDIPEWFKKHDDEDRQSFAARPTHKEMEQIVEEVVSRLLSEFFVKAGKGTKFWLITAATIIGSIAVIGGGAKAILGWLGYHYIVK